MVTPRNIADDLRAAGLEAELLDTDTLANPTRFNAKRYAAVVLPYGNTYPQEAFDNLRKFHKGGGSLVTTGIPFTHPASRLSAKDWEASPEWNNRVRVAPKVGARPDSNAFRISGDPDRFTGVSTAKFPVRPGDVVIGSAALRDVSPANANRQSDADRKDELFVRFFDTEGKFLRQDPITVLPPATAWKIFNVRATTPPTAAVADIALQVRRPSREYLASEFTASVNGTPVTLPNADLSQKGNMFQDTGHQDSPARWGPQGIGIGGFDGPGRVIAPVVIPPGDPFRLKGIVAENPKPQPAPQWIDPKSLPKGVQIVPALGDKAHPLAALIVHTGDAFKGAVDAWAFKGSEGDREDYESRQIIARGTVAALGKRGLLNPAQLTLAFQKLGALPRPKVYANIILPKVPRTYTTFQPKMAPLARHLYVADVRKLKADEKVLMTSLQGIVNRKQPRIYLIFDEDDQTWLEELQRQKETDDPYPVTNPFSLLEIFKSEYKGAVVCDPQVYVSPCIAVALSGADDLLLAKTADLANQLKLPIVTDLRGKFKDNADAYRYLRTELMPRLDPYLTCSLDPAVFDKGGLDHLIAAKGSVFWITGPKSQGLPGANQAGEMAEIREMFANMPLGTVVRGFWWHGDGVGLQEDAGVALGSRFGKITLVSDLITNLSVHSGVPATKLTQKPRPPAPPLDPKKVYLCFTMSDGDNLCTWRGYFRRYFEDPVRGTIPVGWGMGPTIIDMAPDWARWYYEQATPNDEFICDVSGVAYIYPPSWGTALKDRDEAFRYFYGATQDYMEKMDMTTVRLMNVDAQNIAKVGPLLPNISYLMPDYGFAGPTTYRELTYDLPTGQAVFRALSSGSGPQNFADQIRSRVGKARPAFVNVFIWNWGSSLSDLKKTLEILGPEYVAVTPSQLNELYRKSKQ